MQPTCLRSSNPPAPFRVNLPVENMRHLETHPHLNAALDDLHIHIYMIIIYIYMIITDYICNHTYLNKKGICRCQFEHASNPEDFQLPCERRFPSWNMIISNILHSNALQSSPNKKKSNCWLYSYTIHYITTKRVIFISVASLPSGYLT